jgi:catechol 2,3-dioxygenase-like lactoylglutathione lyase family enzyme
MSTGETRASAAPQIESISAVTLATHDMARAIRFYSALGFSIRTGGVSAGFTSLRAGQCYLNLIGAPANQRWSWWGRLIIHTSDVDGMYRHAVAQGVQPQFAPRDAEWGEHYFHITDPDGHELSFARPLAPGNACSFANSVGFAIGARGPLIRAQPALREQLNQRE